MAVTSQPYYDVIVPGSYFCDLIFTGFHQFPSLGREAYGENLAVVPGGVMNTVIGLRRMGLRVGWIGDVGTDLFSRFALEQAEKEGVDTSLLVRREAPFRRVTVAISYPQDRAFVSYIDPDSRWLDHLLNAVDNTRFGWLHFGGLVTDERLPGLIDRCHERRIPVSMDCQERDETLAQPLVRDTLSRLDLFMPNVQEALRLTQTGSLDDTMRVLSEIVPGGVVIKRGADGAIAREQGVDYREPALNIVPVDTTGAGDAFNCGFLTARIAGYDMQTCLRWGCYCGGMSTLGYGGASTAPTRAQVETWMENERP